MKSLIFLLLFSLFGKLPSNPRIPYRQLTWDDFRGPVEQNNPDASARSCVTLYFVRAVRQGKYYFRCECYFQPDSSFVRDRVDRVLRHEQTHFQISYIQSLKCQRTLDALDGSDSSVLILATRVFELYTKYAAIENQNFDTQTNNSIAVDEEEVWEKKISNEVRTLEALAAKSHVRNLKSS